MTHISTYLLCHSKRLFWGCMLMIFIAMVVLSCEKNQLLSGTGINVEVSTDSLFFDTVFASIGSVTKSFKIRNANDGVVKISNIQLSGGSSSAFKININGIQAPKVQNISIAANDSIYVFVQVNIDPTSAQLPFIVRDSILIQFNGNEQLIQLQAYGQNANFINGKTISGNEIWSSALPYVILQKLTIDTNATLTLEPGTRVFLHASAPFVVDGSLIAQGTAENPVTFSGDRLDEDYKDLPGAWPGILFRNTSQANFLEYVTIKNALRGITAEGFHNTAIPKITLSKCEISNIYDAGILAINSQIYADNCLILNCGQNISLLYGGDYNFVHCTAATFGSRFIDHKNPVLYLSNSMQAEGIVYTANTKARFVNSILWGEYGNVDDEISLNNSGNTTFDVRFDHILYKATEQPSQGIFTDAIRNVDPQFDSVNTSKRIYDLQFIKTPGAPAVNAGISTPFLHDIRGNLRDDKPDLGCYER